MRKHFDDPSCEAVLVADASNAFNLLNRRAALLNIQALCPALAVRLINTYRQDPSLFIEDEGATSCHLSVRHRNSSSHLAFNYLAHQLWFADNASADVLRISISGS